MEFDRDMINHRSVAVSFYQIFSAQHQLLFRFLKNQLFLINGYLLGHFKFGVFQFGHTVFCFNAVSLAKIRKVRGFYVPFTRIKVYLHEYGNALFMNLIEHVGKYSLLMYRTFSVPQRWKLFLKQLWLEIEKLGADSMVITFIISIFIGAVMTMQTQMNIENPLLPRYTVGLVTRDTLLLEFCSSIICLILAGKVGSNIASEIGTMRISEQIDAMEIMGVNSANYIILPKILGFMVFIPFLVVFS